MLFSIGKRLAEMAMIALMATGAMAQDMLVEKKTFEMASLTTVSGATVRNVKVGWEAYGTLNADKSNVILVPHFFSGTSHAAGKYKPDDKLPGYWDYLIGPGKAVDTNRFYVISVDSLVNLNAKDPNVVTTGPASINPDTGKPYGMTFPLVTIRDFVNVQKALLDSLGIRKLHAVMGASMGGLQSYEWAASYPDMVERLLPVIAAGDPGPWLNAWLNVWASPILIDANWNKGDYYGKAEPVEGLKTALKIVSLHANHWLWAEKTIGAGWATEGKDPLAAFDNRYKIEATLDAAGAARAAVSDANHFLYLVKANQTFVPGGAKTAAEGLKKIKARTLMLYAPTDQVFAADWVRATAEAIRANGTPVETAEIAGNFGHLNGVLALKPLEARIVDFLTK
ncbi:MAG TPA: homoserine O-acetyltransferase [Beijerinckiaceae bacterium]|nr:homoserine O-acetyltransferase [Beijerinckiaceae bacterium]